MCGRYSQTRKIDELADLFDFEAGELTVEPRYNMAPGQQGLVVVSGDAGNRARLMTDSDTAIDEMVADIDAAEDQVHLMFYIWLPDGNGGKMVEAL